jgi:hypothetical protein
VPPSNQPPETEVERKLKERAAKEKADNEAKKEAYLKSLCPEPLPVDQVPILIPHVLDDGTPEMAMIGIDDIEEGQRVFVDYEEYKKALTLLNSDAPNGRQISTAEYTVLVDMLRHAVGCLEAIGTTTDMEGTVRERLEQSRQVARETAKKIKSDLGVE